MNILYNVLFFLIGFIVGVLGFFSFGMIMYFTKVKQKEDGDK